MHDEVCKRGKEDGDGPWEETKPKGNPQSKTRNNRSGGLNAINLSEDLKIWWVPPCVVCIHLHKKGVQMSMQVSTLWKKQTNWQYFTTKTIAYASGQDGSFVQMCVKQQLLSTRVNVLIRSSSFIFNKQRHHSPAHLVCVRSQDGGSGIHRSKLQNKYVSYIMSYILSPSLNQLFIVSNYIRVWSNYCFNWKSWKVSYSGTSCITKRQMLQ